MTNRPAARSHGKENAMRIIGVLAIVTIVPLGLAVRADEAKPDGAKAIPVVFESMAAVNRLSASITLGSIRVETEIGTLNIPASALTDIEYSGDAHRENERTLYHIKTSYGEQITGAIVAPESIAVTTRYGSTTTNWKGVRAFHFQANARPESTIATTDWNGVKALEVVANARPEGGHKNTLNEPTEAALRAEKLRYSAELRSALDSWANARPEGGDPNMMHVLAAASLHSEKLRYSAELRSALDSWANARAEGGRDERNVPASGRPAGVRGVSADAQDLAFPVAGTRTFAGQVLDADGVPVARATVTPLCLRGKRPKPIRTDATGRYVVKSNAEDSPEDAPQAIRVEAPGLATRIVPLRDKEVTRIQLNEGSTVSGRVLYRGRPLEGVVIKPRSTSYFPPELMYEGRPLDGVVIKTEFHGHWQATTDEGGRFRFENIPQDGDYDLFFTMATLQNFGAIPPRHVKVGPDAVEVEAGDITVEPGHKVAGRIELADGRPVPEGAIVIVGVGDWNWDSIGCPLNEDGRFELRGVPTTSVRVWVSFADRSYAPSGYRLSARNRSLDRNSLTRLLGRVDRDVDGLVILYELGTATKPTGEPAELEPRFMGDRPLAGAETR